MRQPMNSVALLEGLDRVANILRRLGMRPITRLGRRTMKRILQSDLSVNFDGLSVYGSIEHRGHLYRLRDGRKEPYTVELFKDTVKPGHLVLDIGACIGQYTLLAARQVGSTGKVHAFEPDIMSFPFLMHNIRVNGFSDRVTAVAKAVSDSSGAMPFFQHDGNPGRSSLFVPASNEKLNKILTECITIDEFLNETSPVDVIKMDIEGGEVQALKGMERTIAHASDKLAMFIECNSPALSAFGASAKDLLDRLRTLGFNVMMIDEQGARLRPIDMSTDHGKIANLYCIRC